MRHFDRTTIRHRLLQATGALLLVTGCGTELPEPRLADTVASDPRQRAEELARLQQGRELVVQHCAGCHAIKAPGSLPPEAWQAAVDEMRTKRKVNLTGRDEEAIIAYLALASRRSK